MYNTVQTVINATAKNDNTAVTLKQFSYHNLKLGNESSESEITEYNTTESSEREITEDSTAKASESKATDPSESEVNEPSENELTEVLTILKDIGLFDSLTNKLLKLHWLHTKLLQTYGNDEIQSSAIYSILEWYPPGSMLADSNGMYWVRRATAANTRHRFIMIDDQRPLTNINICSQYPLLQLTVLSMNYHLHR